jgi:hypothetical protein
VRRSPTLDGVEYSSHRILSLIKKYCSDGYKLLTGWLLERLEPEAEPESDDEPASESEPEGDEPEMEGDSGEEVYADRNTPYTQVGTPLFPSGNLSIDPSVEPDLLDEVPSSEPTALEIHRTVLWRLLALLTEAKCFIR